MKSLIIKVLSSRDEEIRGSLYIYNAGYQLFCCVGMASEPVRR